MKKPTQLAAVQKKTNKRANLRVLACSHEFEQFLSSKFYDWTKEKTFIPGYKYRADYIVPSAKIIVEFHGGQHSKTGYHTSNYKRKSQKQTHFEKTLHKSNLANALGYSYFQFTYEQLERQEYKEVFEVYYENLKKVG